MKKIKIIAALMCVIALFCSCGQNSKSNLEDVKSVKWILPCATQEDNQLVYTEVNKLVKEKLGFEINFMPVDFGDYNQKMQVINAAGDQYDICFVSNWLNNYYQNIENGNILDITEGLKKYAPETYGNVKEEFWDGIKLDGKIYGVINQQIMAREPFLGVPKVLLEKYNYDIETIKTIEDMEKFAKLVQKDDPECNAINGFWKQYAQILGYEDITGNSPAHLNIHNEEIKVINIYETDEFKDYIQTRKRWVAEGTSKKNITSESGNEVAKLKNNKVTSPFGLGATYKPGVEAEMYAKNNIEQVVGHLTKPMLTTSGVASTLTAVSSSTVSEEAALKAINIVNTDKDVYNMLSFGIEGRNYTKIGDNRIELSKDNPYVVANWAIGNVYNSYLYGEQADDLWEQTAAINESANISPIYGFVPDTKNIDIYLSNCKTVTDEYFNSLDQGIGDVDKLYSEFIGKLENAGVDKIVSELQSQIDAWLAKK